MASDTRKIVIEIKDSKSSEKKSKKNDDEDKTLEGLKVALRPIQSLEKVIVGDSQSAKYLYEQLKNLANQAVNYSINRTANMTEDYLAQNELSNSQKAISKAGGLASSVIAGAAAGSMIAPGIGTVAGAFVGAATYVATEAISGASTLSQYYSNINSATYQSEFSRQRAGLSDEGRGTEN